MNNLDWQYDEFKQVGKDYSSVEEVAIYDKTHAQFRNAIDESQSILDQLGIQTGQRLVDFGCGTGVFAIQAALRGLNVTAVDISQAMLAYAQQRARQAEITNITFCRSGFLNFESKNSFDYVTSSYALHHLPDFWKMQALQNLYGLLNQQGALFLQDVVIGSSNPIHNIERFIQAQAERGGEFMRSDALEHFRDEFSTYDWVLEEMFERVGFKLISKESDEGLIFRYFLEKNC